MKTRGAASVEICTLLDKPERRQRDLKPKYVGFTIPNEFVVGYGLDYDERYRNLPDVCVLNPKSIQLNNADFLRVENPTLFKVVIDIKAENTPAHKARGVLKGEMNKKPSVKSVFVAVQLFRLGRSVGYADHLGAVVLEFHYSHALRVASDFGHVAGAHTYDHSVVRDDHNVVVGLHKFEIDQPARFCVERARLYTLARHGFGGDSL